MCMKMKCTCLIAMLAFLAGGTVQAADVSFNDGLAHQVDYLIDGSLWVENAAVSLYNPAHITGFAITGSGAILDIYGGQIDYMLLVSTSGTGPDGVVTIYGKEFAVDGAAVAADTPELFLANKTLTGVYEDGTPFSIVVDCAISGNASYMHYQTLKLGWIVQQPKIEISHTEYDFGQADVGTTAAGVVTVRNIGNANLTVDSLSLVQSEPVQFGFTPLQVIPMTLEPGASVDVEIFFSPAAEGWTEAELKVTSSDQDLPEAVIYLVGTGLAVELTAEENCQLILDFFDQGLSTGTIQGDGKGKSAWNRAFAFRKTLLVCKQLIQAGYDRYAIVALNEARKLSDGRRCPPDFVKGQDVPAMNTMIVDLINQIKNGQGPVE